MKNDYRDYIQHSSIDFIEHGSFNHKYLKKILTPKGWTYIYKDLKKKTEIKKKKRDRDISYGLRNLRSKITGKNKTFEKNTQFDGNNMKNYKKNISGIKYEQIQRDARKSLDKYNKRNNTPDLIMRREQQKADKVSKKYNRRRDVENTIKKHRRAAILNKFKSKAKPIKVTRWW